MDPKTDGMAMEADASNRPDFGAVDTLLANESSTSTDATPPATPETKADAAPATKELSDDELANLPDEKAPTTEAKADDAHKADPTKATPSADEWEALRQEHPTLTRAELVAMRDRDKNLQAGYTQKFTKLSEQRKALEDRERQFTERFGTLDTVEGETALKIAKHMASDPTFFARFEKALQEIQVETGDVQNAELRRQQYEMDRRFREQEERFKALESRRTEQEAESRLKRLESLAQQHRIDQDTLYARMSRKVKLARANGEDVNVDEMLEPTAKELAAEKEAERNSWITDWKNKHRTAAKVAPIGARGGTAAQAPKKDDDYETPEKRMAAMERYLSGS